MQASAIGLGIGMKVVIAFVEIVSGLPCGYVRFYNGTTWGSATQIITVSPGETIEIFQVSNLNGTKLIATYEIFTVSGLLSYYRIYDGSSWGSQTVLDAASSVRRASVLSNKNIAFVTFKYRVTASNFPLVARIWDGSTLASRVTLESTVSADIRAKAINDNNQALFVYWSSSFGYKSIFYDGASWQSNMAVFPDTSGSIPIALALNNDGTGFLVRQDSSYSPKRLYAYPWNGSAWGTPVRIDANTGYDAISLDIVMRDNIATVIFAQGVGSSTPRIHKTVWNGSSWDTPVTIDDTLSSYDGSLPIIAIDGQGRRFAGYLKNNSGYYAYASLITNSGVETPKLLGACENTRPVLAMAQDETFAIAMFIQKVSSINRIAVRLRKPQ